MFNEKKNWSKEEIIELIGKALEVNGDVGVYPHSGMITFRNMVTSFDLQKIHLKIDALLNHLGLEYKEIEHQHFVSKKKNKIDP